MVVKKFVYISGPRMGTNNEKNNGPIKKHKKTKIKRKK